ncbi:MAG: hypothetical protein PHO75_02220 [Candidatus Shapirobacteria bacterium]|nr:hypothetical protein [Candidatus Shapirobacteria bacterium]
MADNDFVINFDLFNEGLSPLAHIDNKTFTGDNGQASDMKADIISLPGFLQQSPALADLTNGNQAGVVDQLIRFILDKPVSSSVTYAVGTGKLFKLSSTAISSGGSPSWPQTITDMTEGESIIRLGANIFIFYNKSSGGDIATMPIASETIDPDWGSSTDKALEKAVHPCAAKEDIIVFGNGRYLGVYIEGEALLNVQKLDFGEGAEVVDVQFYNNLWYVSVNYGEGRRSQIYLYDASATSNQLSDEVAVGNQRIGFTFVVNGIFYVAYEDKTSGFFAIGWLNGRQITPLRYFTGTLPNHRQKTLYMNTILFLSGANILSCGSVVSQLPIQISILADGGHATLGGIAAPFGTPIIASTNGTDSHRIAKFSGLSVDSLWKSIFVSTTRGRELGNINTIIVFTKPLATGAKAEIYIEGNQAETGTITDAFEVTGENKTMHVFKTINLKAVEDIRCFVDYSNGSSSVQCPIRKIIVLGNFVER